MKKEPVRVLHVVGRMDRGGIETMIMNLYRNIDREKVQFDFLAHYGREAAYNDEIRAMGGRIYEMPALKDEKHVYYWRIFEYVAALHRFFKEHREYSIIHGHMTNTASIYMPIAKKYGVKTCIAHSHSSHGKAGMLGVVTDFLQKGISRHATDYFACSEEAAKWFYPQEILDSGKVRIIHNAIDVERFKYNPVIRVDKRRELGLNDGLVIGCVGRFRKEKNQAHMVKVMKEVLGLQSDSILLFVGDGPCEKEVQKKCADEGIEGNVRFLGMRDDVAGLMQAMDVLVIPSFFEGFPVVGVEAMTSGLPVIASSNLTKELDNLGIVEYISLTSPASVWAKRICSVHDENRCNSYERICTAGFDVKENADWLQAFYLNHQG